MRDHSKHKVATRDEAVEAIMRDWDFTRRVEEVDLAHACGRISAHTVRALLDLPNARISTMDAIAVRFADFADGMPEVRTWRRGEQWDFCNTGVALPPGYDTAIAIEEVELDDDQELVALRSAPARKHECTAPVGSVQRAGDLLVHAGEAISPTLVGVLATGGHSQVDVIAKPVVAYIPTGNELVDPAASIPKGKNIESNGAMICAKLAQWGARPEHMPIVPDDPDRILAALRAGAAAADIVVINAGSSKGSDDWTCEILEREGTLLYHEISQGPGRHCSFAFLEGTPVIGISGPPIGAEFTVDFFVKPLVDLYLGGPLGGAPTLVATMLDDFAAQPRPLTIAQRVIVRRDGQDRFVAWRLDNTTRPVMRGAAEANALISVGPESYGWQPGDRRRVELRYPYAIPPYEE